MADRSLIALFAVEIFVHLDCSVGSGRKYAEKGWELHSARCSLGRHKERKLRHDNIVRSGVCLTDGKTIKRRLTIHWRLRKLTIVERANERRLCKIEFTLWHFYRKLKTSMRVPFYESHDYICRTIPISQLLKLLLKFTIYSSEENFDRKDEHLTEKDSA